MDKDFGRDLFEGLNKIKEITTWLIECLHIEGGRNIRTWKEEEKTIIEVKAERKSKESREPTLKIEDKGVGNTMRKNCYRRSDGRWQYSKQENGMLYYAIANTYRELIAKIDKIQPRQIKTIKRIKTKILTFIEYYKFYIANYVNTKQIKQHTKDVWTMLLKKYIAPAFPRVPLEKLMPEQIQAFVNKIDKERTREVLYQNIVKVLRKAYITGKIKKDITLGIEKPARNNTQTRTPLTVEEQEKLLNYVKDTKLYPFVMFSLIVGSRREETIKFDLAEDLDEEKQIIHIKGTKTRNADRYVYVTKEFIAFLKKHMKSNKFDFNVSYPTHELGKVFQQLKIKNCLHGLRHTCSANLYFLNAKDKYRQLQLGHSSIVTTNNIYTNIKENIPKARLRELYGNLYPSFD